MKTVVTMPSDIKNADGHLGDKCANCGGYGFTVGIKGENISCLNCNKTGVKTLTTSELQERLFKLEKDFTALRKALLNDLLFQGRRAPKGIK